MSRVSGTGSYGNAVVPRKVNPFDEQVKRSLDGEPLFNDESPRFEDWSPAKQRAAYDGFVRADNDKSEQKANADTFLALHKEFLDTNENGQAMNRTLEALYGNKVYTVDEFERAYAVCRANNSLTLDKAEIVKQQQAAANQRAKEAREKRVRETRVFSEDEKETMSLEELREAENREIQQQNRRIAEEGGWY